ncbi:MAG: hypothetical protein Q3961_04580 [Bifidobacteriaceae bacterium]|nr:hypothetical protein [Bifidobacteriaceae bacterium]
MEDFEQNKNTKKPTKRAKIMRGVVSPIFGLIAVACVVFGVLNATIWKPSSSVNVRARVSGVQYVVTDPGVLNLVDSNVNVQVTSTKNVNVCVALGSQKDVNGWLAGQKYIRLTGMQSWTQFTTQSARSTVKSGSTNDNVTFADSDLWTAVTCGERTLTFKHKGETQQVAIIDLGSSKDSADIVFHWNRTQLPHFDYVLYFLAVLFALMTILCASVFAMAPEKRRIQRVVRSTRIRTQESWHTPVKARARRRRHARGRYAGANATKEQKEAPKVVDSANRNIVAETVASESQNVETTTVIDLNELQSYFARFSQELNDSSSDETTSINSQSGEDDSQIVSKKQDDTENSDEVKTEALESQEE